MNELTPIDENTLPAMAQPHDLLAVIGRAAMDPRVDPAKMHSLIDAKMRLDAIEAEKQFNAAFESLQAELPRIKKDGKIVHKGNTIGSFATWEKVDEVIRPLLIKNRFVLRFNSKQIGDKITVFGTLAHAGGHSVTDEIPLTIDASGAKNNVQGVGSTISYGKRYLAGMLLNLIFEGEDDDGTTAGAGGPITDEQVAYITDMLRKLGPDQTAPFLKYMGVGTVQEISVYDYSKAVAALEPKVHKLKLAGA